jgi:hypothetical protein
MQRQSRIEQVEAPLVNVRFPLRPYDIDLPTRKGASPSYRDKLAG